MTFEEVYNDFLEYAKSRHKKQGFYNITQEFNNKIYSYFKKYDLYKLKEFDLLKWQNYILSFNYSNSYNSRLYYVFNLFLDFCVKFHGLESNLLRKIGSFPKKVEYKKFDFYNLEEFNLFISNVDNIIYKQYFNFLFFTGVRPSEAMALTFNDLSNGYVSINKNLCRHGSRDFDTPKNNSSFRSIKLDDVLFNDLLLLKSHYINLYNEERNYFIFGGLKPLSPTTIDRYKKKACLKSNLREITQHQFRHSHATLLLNNGIVINEVSRRLGHSKVSTTLDIYTHTDLLQEKRVISTLNSLRHL